MVTLRQALASDIGLSHSESTGDLTTEEVIFEKKVGTFAYLHGGVTTITAANTMQAIAGTFTNAPLEGFSIVGDELTYTEAETRYFEVDWHATVSADVAGTTVYIGVTKNEAALTIATDPSIMGGFAKYAAEAIQLSGTVVMELAQNDTVQLQIASDGIGDVLTVTHFTTTIRPFFD